MKFPEVFSEQLGYSSYDRSLPEKMTPKYITEVNELLDRNLVNTDIYVDAEERERNIRYSIVLINNNVLNTASPEVYNYIDDRYKMFLEYILLNTRIQNILNNNSYTFINHDVYTHIRLIREEIENELKRMKDIKNIEFDSFFIHYFLGIQRANPKRCQPINLVSSFDDKPILPDKPECTYPNEIRTQIIYHMKSILDNIVVDFEYINDQTFISLSMLNTIDLKFMPCNIKEIFISTHGKFVEYILEEINYEELLGRLNTDTGYKKIVLEDEFTNDIRDDIKTRFKGLECDKSIGLKSLYINYFLGI